jgi:pyruvate, water dikinase
LVVQGSVNPDRYLVFKSLLSDPGVSPIIDKARGAKARKMVYGKGGTAPTRVVDTPARQQRVFVLGDADILTLRDGLCSWRSTMGARWTWNGNETE